MNTYASLDKKGEALGEEYLIFDGERNKVSRSDFRNFSYHVGECGVGNRSFYGNFSSYQK